MKQLNVGCGKDIRPSSDGWVNMDVAPLEGVDVVHSMMRFPWPFPDGTFDHVVCRHVVEHIPHYVHGSDKDGFLLFMEEVHRVLKPGGTLEIRSPHPDSIDRWADPTHTRVVHPKNFVYFEPTSGYGYYTTARFHTRVSEVTARTPIAPGFLPLGRSRLGIFHHLAIRLPFLRPILLRVPWELRVVLEKPAA